MAVRDDIAAIVADAEADKPGRIARLKAARLREWLESRLPFTWQPRANVTVIIKQVSLRQNAIQFVIDLTIRGVTKSLSEWVEGKHSTPDWRILNPPLFVDDPAGDVTIPLGDGTNRIGRDDLVAAMRQAFVDTFGAKIADLLRATR